MKKRTIQRGAVGGAILLVILAAAGYAHFGVVLPKPDVVDSGDRREVALSLLFTHPFEGLTMDMERPEQFGVVRRGGPPEDLLDTLEEVKQDGRRSWKTTYKIRRPGDHVFFVKPRPYWEPSEGKYIVHYTKVVVHALGLEEGWDAALGLETEILPLVRPYGLYTGNLFRGVVMRDGRPVPYAEIEVEYYNEAGLKAPRPVFITQVIKADSLGVFSYACPRAGWWGFAALSESSKPLDHEGKAVPVEIGAVMWVRFTDMK